MATLPAASEGPQVQSLGLVSCLFGCNAGSNELLCKAQWWPVLWTATLFELWVAWTKYIYGGERRLESPAILALIWNRVTTAGLMLQKFKAKRINRKQWDAARLISDPARNRLPECPWIRRNQLARTEITSSAGTTQQVEETDSASPSVHAHAESMGMEACLDLDERDGCTAPATVEALAGDVNEVHEQRTGTLLGDSAVPNRSSPDIGPQARASVARGVGQWSGRPPSELPAVP